jgi:hypothetical protein
MLDVVSGMRVLQLVTSKPPWAHLEFQAVTLVMEEQLNRIILTQRLDCFLFFSIAVRSFGNDG